MNAIIDTDFLLGLFNGNDTHHANALSYTQLALDKGINIFLLPTTLSEFALIASYKIGIKQSHKAISHLISSDFLTIDITKELTRDAVDLYIKQTSKEESLFDCFVMAGAKKNAIDTIFSFDRGYKKNGFVMIEDVFK